MATNVVTCEALFGLVIDILTKLDKDTSKLLRDKLGIITAYSCDGEELTGDINVAQCSDIPQITAELIEQDDPSVPGGKTYIIRITTTDGDGNTTDTTDVPLTPAVTNIINYFNDNDRYVEDATADVQTDADGNPTSATVTLHIHGGDDVTIDLTDLINRIAAADKYLTEGDITYITNPDGSIRRTELVLKVNNGDDVHIDLTELWSVLRKIEDKMVKRYYANLMYWKGKVDTCTRIATSRVGWIFHPDDPRPSDATARIINEDDEELGYAYEEPAEGHNIPIYYTEDDIDVIIGYASNTIVVEEVNNV